MQVPAPFDYERATSVEHAIGLLERLGESARIVAGGHSLLPMMKLRLANFEYLIDINDLHSELGYIRAEGNEIRVGAMTRHRELLESDLLVEAFPIFRDAERVIADPVVRNRGTLGGSLCQADPSEDLSAVCTTLDASCVIQGSKGTRVVSMEDFYHGPYETAVGAAELLIEIRIPLRPGGSSAYEKVERRAGDWAVVSSGAAVWLQRRRHRRRPGRPGRGRAEHGGDPGHFRSPPGQGSLGGTVRAGWGDRGGELQSDVGHARERRVQTSFGQRVDAASPATIRRPYQRTGGLTCRYR